MKHKLNKLNLLLYSLLSDEGKSKKKSHHFPLYFFVFELKKIISGESAFSFLWILWDVSSIMFKCVETGIYWAVWHNPGHQLPRSLHLHSMEHPLSVNTLMRGKPNNAEWRGQEYTQTGDKWVLGQCFTDQGAEDWADNGSCFRRSCVGQLDQTRPCVSF